MARRVDCHSISDGFFVGYERGVGPVCMSCGRRVDDSMDECPSCGARLVWADAEARRRRCMSGYGMGRPDDIMRWGVDLRRSVEGDMLAKAPCATVYRVKGGSMLSEPPVVVFGDDSLGGLGCLDGLDGVAVSLGQACYAVYDPSDERSARAVADAMRERALAFHESGKTVCSTLQESELLSMLCSAKSTDGL